MQPDPVGNLVADSGDPQTWHLYNYVGNRPLVNTDPTGLQPFDDGDDCDDDPSCGYDWGWGWPPVLGGSGGSPQEPTPQPNPPLPSGVPNTTGVYGQGQYGGQGGPYANGFAASIAIQGVGGLLCAGSGVCEILATIAAGGVAAYGAWELGTYIGNHIIFSRKTARDYYPPIATTKIAGTKDPNGGCSPLPPGHKVKWRGSDNSHWHYVVWNQSPDCVWHPTVLTGPDPGPEWTEIPR